MTKIDENGRITIPIKLLRASKIFQSIDEGNEAKIMAFPDRLEIFADNPKNENRQFCYTAKIDSKGRFSVPIGIRKLYNLKIGLVGFPFADPSNNAIVIRWIFDKM